MIMTEVEGGVDCVTHGNEIAFHNASVLPATKQTTKSDTEFGIRIDIGQFEFGIKIK